VLALRVGVTRNTFWMNFQAQHDPSIAASAVRDELAAITLVEAA